MARGKKKKPKIPVPESSAETEVKEPPIENLPANFLWMRVKSGTKMRNVLEYGLKHFPDRGAIVWSAVGQGISKAISCAELFKRKTPGLHQVTRLRYVASKEKSNESNESGKSPAASLLPEVHILLTRDPTHIGQPGYQAAGDNGEFVEAPAGTISASAKSSSSASKQQGNTSSGRITSLAAEEFAAMGLRTGQKRSRKEPQQTGNPSKRNKKKTTANGV